MDLRIENHGSVFLLRPESDAGQNWLDENVETESWQHFGGAVACEPRCAEAVVDGAIADGLAVA